jgi:shikimate dehydrogenase
VSLIKKEIDFPNSIFKTDSLSYDLFYSKNNTIFQDWSDNNGVKKSYNGLGMLIEQAALSFNIWNDFKPVTEGISKKLGF